MKLQAPIVALLQLLSLTKAAAEAENNNVHQRDEPAHRTLKRQYKYAVARRVFQNKSVMKYNFNGEKKIINKPEVRELQLEGTNMLEKEMMSMPTTMSPTASPAPTMSPTASPAPTASLAPTQLNHPSSLPTITSSAITTSNPTIATSTTLAPTTICQNTESRATAILNVLSTVSDINDLTRQQKPQGKAYNWIVDQNPQICPDSQNLVQRYVLALLYFQMNGPNWFECSAAAAAAGNEGLSLSSSCNPLNPTNPPTLPNPLEGVNWLSVQHHECEWAYIICNDDSAVTEIQIDENNVGGEFPSEISALSDTLQVLSMDGNLNIQGQIPQSFGLLSNLRFFDIDNNRVKGQIPETLYDLHQLQTLDLNDNLLTGTLSTRIANLTKLEFFQVENNQKLKGTVPTELGSLQLLEVFTCHGTDLEGTMPQEVCQLRDNINNNGGGVGGGPLKFLFANCGQPNPDLACDCCNGCF